ncbi:hypothetical protein AX14_003156 [Amanita brunnescens Koide BX004]|nr:hypothetical protein AX14_003156 [Amanita brunnescens Koide BX004]
MTMSGTVDIPQPLKTAIRDFRLSKRGDATSALVVKINRAQLAMQVDEEYEDITIEDLAKELPENAPRFVLLSRPVSYSDGRKSYPIVLLNWVPSTCEIGMLTLHASSRLGFQNAADVMRVVEVRDGPESLTSKEIDDTLRSFR